LESSARSSAQSAFGVNLQRKLAARHKSRETGDHVRLIISMLVTFSEPLRDALRHIDAS
jgi:hypothetical protein